MLASLSAAYIYEAGPAKRFEFQGPVSVILQQNDLSNGRNTTPILTLETKILSYSII